MGSFCSLGPLCCQRFGAIDDGMSAPPRISSEGDVLNAKFGAAAANQLPTVHNAAFEKNDVVAEQLNIVPFFQMSCLAFIKTILMPFC